MITYKLQLSMFERKKNRLLKLAWIEHRENGDLDKYQLLSDQASKMVFRFDKSNAKINFGFCSKINKDIQFIPNTCQLNTQECFEHRKKEA